MVKRILLSIVMLMLIAYLGIAITAFNRKPANQTCRDVELVIKDTTYAGFITKEEVKGILQHKGIYPIGKKMERISTKSLERELSKHPLIDEAECYKTPSGKVCVEVTQRIPILRIMSANGENYYLDNKGTVMPPEAKCVAHRAIVTGNVEKSFAMKDLYKFGVFLQNNKFWDAQIEQIHVLPDRNIELVPRVGDHLVYLGKLENFENKLARLKEFYQKGPTEFIAAIELGSSKITGVAGRKNSDGSMQILAYAQEDSSTFIRKGVIFNLDKTAQSLTSIINRLEGELKNSIAKVYVGIGGQSLRTVRNVVSRDLEEEAIISEELVSAIGDENVAIPVVDMDILDVAPQEYKVGNNLQANPVGLVGSHIEGRFLNIVARSSVRKNLEHCFQQAKIDIADQLIAPLVTANAVLTESERRSGCALIDFGADTTTISVYKNNILRFLTVLPLGGNSITRDITTLQMEEEEAERLKKTYGDALYEEDESEEPATCKLEDESRTVELSKLNNIIEARAEEIIANVWNQIQISGYEDKLLAGIILTGGAANLKNLEEMLRRRSKIEKMRMAKLPRNTVHAPSNILKKDGSQNTLFGLLFEGNQNCCLIETAPQIPVTPATPRPEPEIHKTVDMFEDDQELKEQARLARLKKEEEEKEARAAAKEAERLRKQKEKEEKERRKREAGPSWIQRKIDSLTKEIFSDDDMK